MDIEIKRDKLDGSDWITVVFSAIENDINHDTILELECIRHRHKLSGGSSHPSSFMIDGILRDSYDVYIENPTPEFETDLQCWLFKT